MIRETAAHLFPYDYLWSIYKRTKIKPNSLDVLFRWLIKGTDKSDDKKELVAFKDIASKIKGTNLATLPSYPLYRGITVSAQAIHNLQEATRLIKLKPKLITAWRQSYAFVDERMIQEETSNAVGLVVQGNPRRVILNITPALINWLDEGGKLKGLTRELNETIVYGNGIDFIAGKSIKSLNYKGKSITLDRFQMQFPIDEKDYKISFDDKLKQLLHGIPVKPIRLARQPPDGKSFHYVIKNTTNTTFLDIMHQLEGRGYHAGITRFSKRGKKVDLVDKLNDKIGITLEENSGMRIIKLVLVPMEQKLR